MQQTSLILRFTIKNLISSKLAVFLLVAFAVLQLFAAYSSYSFYQSQKEIIAEYQTSSRADWEGNPDKHPHRMAHYGNYAFRQPSALSVFDYGLDRYMGNAIFLESHVMNTSNFSEAEYSSGLVRFGFLDMGMILQLLTPLLIFFLGFNLIASERENGSLKLSIAQGISWKNLIIGKSLALFIFTSTLLLVPIGLLFFLAFAGEAQSLRIVLLAGLYLLYFLFLSFITTLVSAHAKSAKQALNSLIGVWLLFFILLPKVSQALGAYFYEIPSKAKFALAVEEDIIKTGDSHNQDDPYYAFLKDSLLTAYNVETVKELPFNYSGFQMKVGERITTEIHQFHHDNLLDIYRNQNRFSKIVSLINPYLAVKNLSMAFAGTDFDANVHFQEAAEEYRYYVSQKMNQLQIDLISNESKGSSDPNHLLDKQYWADVEDFEHQQIPLTASVSSEVLSVMSLLLWGILIAWGIYVSSKKLRAI